MDLYAPTRGLLARRRAQRIQRRIERSRTGRTTLNYRRNWQRVNLVAGLVIVAGATLAMLTLL